jgi:hypothetical protein
MSKRDGSIAGRAVGAFGERAAEAELLRNGWIPANVNATVKNSADFDIYARKPGSDRTVHLRVKACKPNSRIFQFGGFKPEKPIPIPDFNVCDFTILVSMGGERATDQFYVVPTRVVRKEIALRRRDYLKVAKRDGGARKDTGHWALYLDSRQDGKDEGGYGLAKKWKCYLENWKSFESDVD